MTKFDVLCVVWLFGLTFSLVLYAWPSWEEPKVQVVKVRVNPILIDGPKEVRR